MRERSKRRKHTLGATRNKKIVFSELSGGVSGPKKLVNTQKGDRKKYSSHGAGCKYLAMEQTVMVRCDAAVVH